MYKNVFLSLAFIVTASASFAAWYLDRDNSMEPAELEVGEAMAVVLGPTGTVTQAIQVCSGVYLATAHGALDSPLLAREQNRMVTQSLHTPIVAYPMTPANQQSTEHLGNMYSPRLRDPSLWDGRNEHTDYVFIKVDHPVRSDVYVTPLNITPEQLVEMSSSINVHMYRGNTRYQLAGNAALNFDENLAISRFDIPALEKLYETPQKVTEACAIMKVLHPNNGFVSHNCPTESGTSGSSYVSNINGRNYLVGLNTLGSNRNFESSTRVGGSALLTSSSFCADFEQACGQPCATLDDVME